MEEQSTFETFLQQRIQSLLGRLDEAKHEFSNEHIRRLRVGIKRWRTLYRLVTTLQPLSGKSRKVERSVKQLFRRAGKVRDNQLNRQLVVGLGLPTELENEVERFFKKREKKARKRLKKTIKSIRTKPLKKLGRVFQQSDTVVDSGEITRQLSRLMAQEAQAIQALSPQEASTEQLHMVRKHLKSLIEMGEVIRNVTPNKSLINLVQRAKTVQRRMGNWHDYISLIEHLNDFIAKHPGVLPPRSIRSLQQRFDRLMQQRTKRVRNQVDKLGQWLPLLTS